MVAAGARATHTARTIRAGAHTHARRVMAGSPGLAAARAAPAVAMTAAGTYAQRCGRVVLRVERNASMAHPAANATRAAPMTPASDASGTTPNDESGRAHQRRWPWTRT